MSNNINNNNAQQSGANQQNQESFNVNYQKRKNVELFQSLEKIANVSKLQNYIPIYSRFFSLNLQNYNSVNLNNKWFISNVYSLCDDEDEDDEDDEDASKGDDDDMTEDNYISQCLYNCKIKNMLNQKSKEKVVFMKFAPLLDPIKFMTGKYQTTCKNDNTNANISTDTSLKPQNNEEILYNLPSFESGDEKNKVHPKLLNVNNSAYVDSFFVYLSSTLLHHTNFIHGLDYYGSFLGIKKNYTFNIYDDLDYLVQSDYFTKNKNILFEVDDENYDYESNNQYSSKNLKKLVINDETGDIDITNDIQIDKIENTIQLFGDIFMDDTRLGDCDVDCDTICENLDLQEISFDKSTSNLPFDKMNTSLKSSSSCSSRTSYTSNSSDESLSIKIHDLIENEIENDDQCHECGEVDEIPDLINLEDDAKITSSDNGNDEDSNTEYTSYDSDSEYIEARIPEFPVELICMESCENTFDDLIAKDGLSEEEWLSAFMQIIMILLTYQKTFSFTHNDLHTNNVMYNYTDKKYIYYCYKNQYYKVPTFGRLFKIIDFGRAIYKYKGNLFCSDSFENGGDAATQYNTEPYFNDKKPRIDPNYSFDICRLACSIFDYLVEDISNVKYLENNNPIVKLVVEWCSDDKGINLLYKATGEDRYPEFKLYKMIARCSHNHTPENQLNRPEFSKFVVPFNTISKSKGVIENLINIDKIPILSK
jgi:hypothetical protein